jgi:hypothetical protein
MVYTPQHREPHVRYSRNVRRNAANVVDKRGKMR